ncbi:ankyrin repeat-containing domain protein [Nemania abortiva]|nr:ankyrin repeat-containing domain protein [Nemania abortiva]
MRLGCVQDLVKIGLHVHEGAWERRCVDFLFKSVAKAGFGKMGILASRLITNEIIESWPPKAVDEILFLAAYQLDTFTVSVLIQTGACFMSIPPILKAPSLWEDRHRGWHMSDFEQLTSLLLKALFRIDCKTFELGATRADWMMYLLSAAGHPNAAGEQLRLYLEPRKEEQGLDRQTALEIALCVAAKVGDTTAIQSLVGLGVGYNTPRSREEYHPLLVAAENPSIDAFGVLINLGADTARIKDYFPYVEPYWNETKWTSDVQKPMDMGFADMVLQTSIPPDAMMGGLNLIQIAIRKCCTVDAVKFFHSRPGPEWGTTMIHDAVKYGRHTSYKEMTALVEFLVGKGANYLLSPLLDRGAELVRPRKLFWHSNNGVLMALTRCRPASDDLILRIMNSGADINCRKYQYPVTSMHHQWTPLQAAIHEEHHEIARQLLLLKGADINAPEFSNDGRTALQAACNPLNGAVSLGFVQILLDHSANMNAPGLELEGLNALQCAIVAQLISVFCLLLDAGADVNATARCSLGSRLQHYRTLDVAAYYGRLDMVDVPVKKNGESEIRGRTPLDGAIDCATNGGHHAIARMLRDRFDETVFSGERVYDLNRQVTESVTHGDNWADLAEDQDQGQLNPS